MSFTPLEGLSSKRETNRERSTFSLIEIPLECNDNIKIVLIALAWPP